MQNKGKAGTAATLIGLIGVASAGIYTTTLDRWEGNVLRGYRDVAGIATKCRGVTGNVIVGRAYSAGECAIANEAADVAHVRPVIEHNPELLNHPHALAAAGSLAYNVGIGGWKGSTAARRFAAGDMRGGCLALGPTFEVRRADFSFATVNGFVRAGGRRVQGLVNRRQYERDLCLRDVPA